MIDGRKGAFVGLEALGHGLMLGPEDTHVFIFFHTKGLVALAWGPNLLASLPAWGKVDKI